MSEFNFKSVGRKLDKQIKTVVTGSLLPIGFRTPLRFGNNSEGLFSMNYEIREQISDNLKNLLLTNHGERVMNHDFGANLQPITYEIVSSQENFEDEAIIRIKDAVSRFMPYVSLKNFISTIINHDNLHTGKIKINITYEVPEFSIVDDEIEIMLYIV